ncbi:putative hydrolase of the HAD superfamily [Chitinophaga japonensis]|uniref:Putative hydrolase of the HAD superfamily n=2 Tax=Chitinophaga japonensis TaxID=104662 RepID=A0A562TDR8_CHIJA|nr:putative hydrolase of the HAD superfamily [Chitinophaga japonensis]
MVKNRKIRKKYAYLHIRALVRNFAFVMKYKHIFFDLDHTLWDFETNSYQTLQELYHHFDLGSRGVPSFDAFYNSYVVHNEQLWDRFRKGFINRNELRTKRFRMALLDFKIGDEKLAASLGSLFLEILPTKTALFPYTAEVLGYLKEKQYPLHMITNGFEETQLQKMRNAGIDHYFTHIITSEVAGSLKPYREIFDFAVTRAAATVTDCIMIGDALDLDIAGAHNVGMDQVYFNPKIPATGIQPTYTISCLSELKTIF